MSTNTRIIMVKKIMEDGNACRKCIEVERRLRDSGYLDRIDHVVVADARDPDSEGMQLATRYQIERAPFFIVEEPGREPRVYTVYMRLLKDILQVDVDERDEAREILERNPSLDYI